MPSPFPGMDPYLENPAYWAGFHGGLLVRIQAELTRGLPARYYVEIDVYVWIEMTNPDSRRRLGKPDAYFGDRGDGGTATAVATVPTTGKVTVALPLRKKQGSRYLRITDAERSRVVTVVELLSPSNKATGADRRKYLRKRDEYFAGGVNVVEIDLLRAGERMPLGTPSPVPNDYYILVSRAAELPQADVWGFSVRDPFPAAIPVPLNPEDAPQPLNLKSCLDRAYDEAELFRRIDYSQPPVPSLRDADAAWAKELLAARAGH